MRFVDSFKKSVVKYKDKTALVDSSNTRFMTYEQLDKFSSQIAAKIVESGCKKGDIVPVRMERCMEYIASEIGVMKAGCVFSPLIMDYPDNRVNYIMNLCESKFCIDLNFALEAKKNKPLEETVDTGAEDGIYAVFTSGSTGNPKGILHTNQTFDGFRTANNKTFDFTNQDIFLDTITHSFIFSKHLFLVLEAGGTVHTLTDNQRKDIHYIEDYIAAHKITFAIIPPAQQKNFHCKAKSLRKVIAGGERLSGAVGKGYQLINYYGSTETNGIFSFFVDKPYDNTPIGKPLEGVHAYVLDNEGKKVEQGTPGELCLSGNMLSIGYIKMPEQTAKMFTQNPYSVGDDDKILYHTGDIVKILPDGNYLYVNRKDWMVKINGQRVEPGEIEIVTAKVPGVIRSVVKAFQDKAGQWYLVNYYKVKGSVSSQAIKVYLHKNVPDYMIPRFFIQIDAFPLNPNGKIDRNALEPPKSEEFKEIYVEPNNTVQIKLCMAFEQALDCGRVGIHDDFFALGGDSIATAVMINLCKLDGLEFSMVYEGKTPEKISELYKKSDKSQTKAICRWHQKYEAAKPVLVVIEGITSVEFSKEKIRTWSELFNVLEFSPITEYENFMAEKDNIEEMIKLDHELLMYHLPDEATVFGFIGFCFGGVMGYRMAVEYAKETGIRANVYLCDSFVYEYQERELFVKKAQEKDYDFFNVHGAYAPKFVLEEQMLVFLLDNMSEYPSYHGNVTLFLQKDLADKQNNISNWRKIAKNLSTVLLDGNHFDLTCADTFLPTYTEKLLADLKNEKK